MVKNHLKRLAVPKTWNIPRKLETFVARPRGYINDGLPASLIMNEILNLTTTRKETKAIVHEGKVLIDGKKISDERQPVILMGVLEIQGGETYRILLNEKGKLVVRKIDESQSKLSPCKVISKTILKGGKLQIGFHNGRTMLSDNKDIKVGDTIVLKIPDMKLDTHLKLEKGATVFLTGGSNVGKTGSLENIGRSATIKIGKDTVETYKKNIFVIGKEAAVIKVD